MRYCPRCQMMYSDECTTCTNCRNSRLRPPVENDPVFLTRASEMDFLRISGILQDHDIPFEERDDAQTLLPPILAGTNLFDARNIFVPYAALEQSRSLLAGIGIEENGMEKTEKVEREGPPEQTRLEEKTAEDSRTLDTMPRWKRFLFRAVFVLLIGALIWAVVAASDFAFAWIKDALNNTFRT